MNTPRKHCIALFVVGVALPHQVTAQALAGAGCGLDHLLMAS
jgi:hypothetical protein